MLDTESSIPLSTDAPLSALIAQHIAAPSNANYLQFLTAFQSASVGVVSVGYPEGVSGKVITSDELTINLAASRTPDGLVMVLTFADPATFIKNFGNAFHGEMYGIDVLKTALHNPECQGVQVNSALSEVSILIHRQTIESLLQNKLMPPSASKKPWWKFW